MLQLAELQKKGQFKANREKDVLSTAIGSKEHGGHVRGMSSKLSIKDGFEKDRARYRSHDRYKEEIVAAAENAMEARLKDLFFATLAEQQQSGLLMINVSQEVDTIMSNTPCLLLYPVGRAGKTKEVAKAQEHPARGFICGKTDPHWICMRTSRATLKIKL